MVHFAKYLEYGDCIWRATLNNRSIDLPRNTKISDEWIQFAMNMLVKDSGQGVESLSAENLIAEPDFLSVENFSVKVT